MRTRGAGSLAYGDLRHVGPDGSTAYLQADGLQAEIATSNATTYPLADALGSVRDLSDGSGALSGTADYSVFGAVRSQSGASSTFGYTGEQTDAATGLVYLRARYLSPALGRFLSADSVQPNAPGTTGYNTYAYVANNPTTWTDPSGHQVAAGAPRGGNEYATLLALSLLAVAALMSLAEAIVAAILSVVCYLDLECVHALDGARRKTQELGSDVRGALGRLPGNVGDLPGVDPPTIRFPSDIWKTIRPGLSGGGDDPSSGGDDPSGETPGIDIAPIICLLGVCHLPGLPDLGGGSSSPGAGSPGTNPDPPTRADPGTSPVVGPSPVPGPGPQPKPQPVTLPPGSGTATPPPNKDRSCAI